MTSPIDPIGRAERVRRIRRTEGRRTAEARETGDSQRAEAPSALEPLSQPDPTAEAAAAAFAAQLFAQDAPIAGEPQILDAAKTAYTRTEWSGKADRRAPKGRLTDEDI